MTIAEISSSKVYGKKCHFCSKLSPDSDIKRDQKTLSHNKNIYTDELYGPSTAILSLAKMNFFAMTIWGDFLNHGPFYPKNGFLPPWRGQKSTPKLAQNFHKIFSHPCATFDR